ncbi:MAG: hypothetical protein ABSB19_03900 [Methylomonas sp.]
MKSKKSLSLLAALLAISGSVQALDVFPTLDYVNNGSTNGSVPGYSDWSFWFPSQTITVSQTSGNYVLTSNGASGFSFFNNGTYAGNATYSLSATFNSNGTFIPNAVGSDYYTISGDFSSSAAAKLDANNGLSGTNLAPTTYTTLLDANLSSFGFNNVQDTIGFGTSFNPSWSNNQVFTGGSPGESVYLYSVFGFNSDGTPNLSSSALAGLIAQFASANLTGGSFASISSVASVPVPFAGLLFASGLTALLGVSRRNVKNS